MIPPQKKYMTLLQIAKILHIKKKATLQHYASKQIQLIRPVIDIPESRVQLYDFDEVKQMLKIIKDFKSRGYNLEDIRNKLLFRQQEPIV